MAECSLMENLKGMNIQQYKTDVGFRTLVESVNENLYIIPKYQRKYRWTKEQVAALVNSLICGLPIPPIYTCRNEKNQLEILDGQQRIMSLFFYYIGFYLNNKKNSSIDFSELVVEDCTFKEALMSQFSLDALHIELEGKEKELINVDYSALPMEIKRRVDYTSVTIVEIKIEDEKQRSKILRKIFANLNTGGSLLSQQEQRNGIYVCAFYDMLQNLNRYNNRWRRIWGREDARERDMETLLRFCALKKYVNIRKQSFSSFDFVIEGYNSSYAKLLDQFSEEAMGFDAEQIWDYKNSLTKFFELFEVNRVQSSKVALIESFYIVYEKLGVDKPISSMVYDTILKSPQYIEHARQGTVKMRSMNERWKIVYEIWTGDDRQYC